MQISKISFKFSAIALVTLMTLSIMIIALPTTTAQDVLHKDTFPFINAIPNPIGVNQEVLLHVGILTAHIHGDGWKGLTVTVTRPDGTTETLGPFNTDSTGGTGSVYIPNQVGTYTLQTHFPEQVLEVDIQRSDTGTLLPAGTVMKEGSSEIIDLVVQADPVPIYPGHSLPTEYWSRPIDAQLYEWTSIAGNWLAPPPNLYAPYNDGPETAHILWTKPVTGDGGLVGGENYDYHAFHEGDAYEGEWGGSVILNGVLYYNKYLSAFTYGGTLYPGAFYSPPGVVAVDLHTGEELWYNDEFRINFGQIYYYSSSNQHGALDYLVSTGAAWNFYDAATGDWQFAIENVSSGYQYYGPNGEIMIVNVDTINNRMTLWDNTAIPELLGGFGGASEEMWRPYLITVDGNKGYVANVSIPSGLGVAGFPTLGIPNYVAYDDRVIGLSWDQEQVTVWGLRYDGTSIFTETWTPPSIWKDSDLTIQWAGATSEATNGVIAVWSKEQRQFFGFSTENGQYLWTTPSECYLDAYGWGSAEHTWSFAYDRLYSTGVGGIVYCYDLATGQIAWSYQVSDPYNEFLFSVDWWEWFTFITDGKIYMGHAEHSPLDPKPRGGPFVCLDAITGNLIWRADGLFRQTRWGGRGIIGDSIMATMDTYDGRVYAVGKGPSETTVASAGSVTLGTSTAIEGTVMDVSPGTEDSAIRLRFPKGVPAVSDASMSEWMLYVYKQFEMPAANGVTVKMEAVDPNGNYQNYGTVTTDCYGKFGFAFEPEVPGLYMLIATFEGSEAYYASTDTTYIMVNQAPTPETPIEPEEPTEPEVPTEPEEPVAPLISTEVAIIAVVVVIAVIGLVAYLVLRKRE